MHRSKTFEVKNIRKILQLEQHPWIDMPNDLLEMAFRPSSVVLNTKTKKDLIDRYSMSNLEDLEFLGDAVIELSATLLVFDSAKGGPGYMTKRREELVRNTALYCLMDKSNMCAHIEGRKQFPIKTCADVFEALIGALCYYLVYIKHEPKYMDIIQDYLEQNFYTEKVIEDLIEQNVLIDTCEVSRGITALKAGKEYIIKKPETSTIPIDFTPEELELLQELEHADKPKGIDLSNQTRDKIQKTFINHQWMVKIYNDWKSGKEPFPLLQNLYQQFYIDKYAADLYTPEEGYNDFGIVLYKINFNELTLDAYYSASESIKQDALNMAANEALTDIFTYFPFKGTPKLKRKNYPRRKKSI